MKKYSPYIFIVIFSLIFISRFIIFVATQDVGIEHDSGWYLSVARNLAEKGIYASSINTIENSDKRGPAPSIHERSSVQDEKGYSYFPAGVTVGPGFIIPEALILKIFGSGWIQFRIWPLFCFSLLVVLLFTLVYRFGGIVAFVFFGIWMWFYPQIWINQSFEAFSEQIALLYLLMGLILISQKKLTPKLIVFGGLFIGLSAQTKSLFFLAFPSIVVLHLVMRRKISSTLLLIASVVIPTLLFELYRLIYLYSHFGMAGYMAINNDQYLQMKVGGSGLLILSGGLSLSFIENKMNVWRHVGVPTFLFGVPLILSSFLRKSVHPLLAFVMGCFFSFFVWYVLLSQMGWFRHAFPGVILGMVVISIIYSQLIRQFPIKKLRISALISIVFCLMTFYMFVSNQLAIPFYSLKKDDFDSKKPFVVNNLQGPFFAPIFSKSDEVGVGRFITSSVHPKNKLCYEGWFLIAELPVIMDRVIFPLRRCSTNDILVIGPYQRGRYNVLGTNEGINSLVKERCGRTVFENPSYLLCVLK